MSSSTRSDGPDASAPGASEEAGGPGRTVERPWLTVMMRELAVKVRNRSVLISTAVTLVLIVGGLVASSLLSGTDSGSEHEIAAVGAGSVEMVEAVDDSLSDDDSASPREATRQEAEQLLDDGDGPGGVTVIETGPDTGQILRMPVGVVDRLQTG